VRADFDSYGGLLDKNGMIALHDIRTTGRGHEVERLWHEVSTGRHCREIAYRDAHLGIGVVFGTEVKSPR
jgi:hypothetical protein